MKEFEAYLLGKRVVLAKNVPYYVGWVKMFYRYLGKEPGKEVDGR